MKHHFIRTPLALFALPMLLAISGCVRSGDALLQDFLPSAKPLVLGDVTVVDVRRGRLLEGMDVSIDDGLISNLTSAGGTAPAVDAHVIDARGKYLVPGYVDMHVHVLGEHHLTESLALMLANGVTGFRQMSGSPDLLKARRTGSLPVPEGAPRLLAMPGTVLTPLNSRNPKAAVKQVQVQAANGADFIKVGLVSAEAFTAVMQEARHLNIPVAGHVPPGIGAGAPIVAEMRSIEHLGALNALAIACSDGAAALGDGATPEWLDKLSALPFEIPFADRLLFFLIRERLVNPIVGASQSVLDDMRLTLETFSPDRCRDIAGQFAAHGTWHVPTLINTKRHYLADSQEFLDDSALEFVDKGDLERWRKVTRRFSEDFADDVKNLLRITYEREVELVRLLDSAGVTMLTGSDGGPGWVGAKLHAEFDELGAAGLPALKVLQMATLNAARFLNQEDQWGTVELGMRADLVLLNGNPMDDVQNLHEIEAVIIAGRYYSRQDLQSLKRRVAALRAE